MYGAGDVRVEPLGDGDLLRQHHDRRRASTGARLSCSRTSSRAESSRAASSIGWRIWAGCQTDTGRWMTASRSRWWSNC